MGNRKKQNTRSLTLQERQDKSKMFKNLVMIGKQICNKEAGLMSFISETQ